MEDEIDKFEQWLENNGLYEIYASQHRFKMSWARDVYDKAEADIRDILSESKGE